MSIKDIVWPWGALKRERLINEWWLAQHKHVEEIFSEAWKVISIPDHTEQFKKSPAGNQVMVRGTMLNFDTLKEMLWLMLDMESERRVARNRMAKLMGDLATWETAHPFGEPIKETVQDFIEKAYTNDTIVVREL